MDAGSEHNSYSQPCGGCAQKPAMRNWSLAHGQVLGAVLALVCPAALKLLNNSIDNMIYHSSCMRLCYMRFLLNI